MRLAWDGCQYQTDYQTLYRLHLEPADYILAVINNNAMFSVKFCLRFFTAVPLSYR